MALRARWLGRVPYREALALQEALFAHGRDNHLLLLEHPHVFTHGARADLGVNLRVDPAAVGAELVAVNRGGDVTYHGPGQLVGYPIVDVPTPLAASDHVCAIQRLIVAVLTRLGVADVGCLPEYPGVWVGVSGPTPRKICAIGVRIGHRAPDAPDDASSTPGGRTMHGFALNLSTDLTYMRDHIVPCGIAHLPVTSIAEEGVDVSMREVVDVVVEEAAAIWGGGTAERQDVAWKQRPDDLSPFSRGEGAGAPIRSATDHLATATSADVAIAAPTRAMARLEQAGVTGGLEVSTRKPEWLRPRVVHGPEVLALQRSIREHGLVTVCEEAGCPNLSECWSSGTATFMVLGERCTRACGFCLVDTRRPDAPAADEPQRVASAVRQMGVRHAVLTMVARDDLDDGGMRHVAACIDAIRAAAPGVGVETLVSDARGDRDALAVLWAARPDVFNHNVETVARLQRAVRPSAGYARSLAVLAGAKAEGLVTKSGFMLGLGETDDEVEGLLADLAGIGIDIVTIGQYLRPTTHHLPVARWAEPAEFARWKSIGESLGIGHVESSPLTRSSYHAHDAAAAVTPVSLARRQ
ncbi:MAG: lipoyl synthase [Ilumatobacteraceae bacterium]